MNGEHGFKVKRRFPSSFEYDIGDIVTPQDAIKIPIRNRIALERSGMIEFLAEPADKSLQVVIDEQAEEIEILKAEIETLKSGNGKREALEKRAGELGVNFRKNTSDEKLEKDIQEKEKEDE